MTVTVSARGQMVIPALIRKKYNITLRSNVELLDLGKEIVIVPVPRAPIARSKGILKGVRSADLIRERMRLRHKEHS
jgi:AbrB family looped-hinge helix DNA binding protein